MNRMLLCALVCFSLMLCCALACASSAPDAYDCTWSIVAYDPDTGDLGVIVTTKRPAVGNRCPWAVAGIGAVSTQANTNPLLATQVLDLLAEGHDAQSALDLTLAQDLDKEDRQIGVVDRLGNVAAFTGEKPQDWKGHHTALHYSVQGNILAGKDVVTDTASVFERSTGPLAYRLLDAMDAGQEAGGDQRGRQSAALIVVRPGWIPYIDVRVDDNEYPLVELRRQLDLWMAVVNNSPPAPQYGKRLLALHARGVDVRDSQVMLRDLGYFEAAIDGQFGVITDAAVRKFQSDHALSVDGIVGSETSKTLVNAYEALYPGRNPD